jgi:flagellar protein FlbT
MSGLVLKLSPKERVLINGAVIENGDKRSKINIVTPNANILRLRDALHPKDINSPVKRVCYVLQLILSGDASVEDAKPQVLSGLKQLAHVFDSVKCKMVLDSAYDQAVENQFYRSLRTMRELIAEEDRLLKAMV